jgi:hypothetical protein
MNTSVTSEIQKKLNLSCFEHSPSKKSILVGINKNKNKII